MNNLPDIQINTTDIDLIYNFFDNYIGEGYSGDLILCKNKLTSKKYILKSLPLNEQSLNEIKIQLYLKSKYIINIIDIFKDNEYYYIILDFANGDLFNRLNYINVSESLLKNIIIEISKLVEYVHSKDIVHADLKLENVLIYKKRLVLCDFGFSKFENEDSLKIYYTKPYTSPEQLTGVNFTTKSDIWSVGVVAYYLYFDKFTFNQDYLEASSTSSFNDIIDVSKYEMLDFNIDTKPALSNKFQQLLQSMLEVDYNKRPDIKTIINILENE